MKKLFAAAVVLGLTAVLFAQEPARFERGIEVLRGNILLSGNSGNRLCFGGATADANQTCFTVVDPTGSRVLTFPNVTASIYPRTSFTTQINNRAKVGSAAGWVVGAATNLPYVATMAASQTAGTLVIPVHGLHVGDTITGFRIVAQVESAGQTVTIDAALRAVTNVAAEPTDAAIANGAITQVSVTEDTAVSQAVTGIAEVVTSGKTYYILVTATTGSSTDIILQATEITVTQS